MLEPCIKHHDATAGWSCDSCEAKLCPACTAEKISTAGTTLLCTRCGGRARPILMKRGALQALVAPPPATPLGGLRGLVRPRPSAQDDELVPVLGDTTPLIQLGAGDEEDGPVGLDHAGNPIAGGPQTPRTYEPIALDDDDGGELSIERGFLGQPAPAAPLPVHEVELDLDPGPDPGASARPPARPPPPPPEAIPAAGLDEEPNAALARLTRQGQQPACLDVLERSGQLLRAETLPPQGWLALGTFALDQKRAKAATFALRRCIDAAPEGVLAPQAWLLAARTYDQLLGDRKTSDRLLQEVATRFPQTKEGQFAARRLATRPG